MSVDFVDLVKLIGTFAFFAMAGIVGFMLVVSLIDRNPKRKTRLPRQTDTKPAESARQRKDTE